jgi:hypothetical protein
MLNTKIQYEGERLFARMFDSLHVLPPMPGEQNETKTLIYPYEV